MRSEARTSEVRCTNVSPFCTYAAYLHWCGCIGARFPSVDGPQKFYTPTPTPWLSLLVGSRTTAVFHKTVQQCSSRECTKERGMASVWHANSYDVSRGLHLKFPLLWFPCEDEGE